MCMRNILASIVGAVIVMAWSTASWMFLPWHNMDMKGFKENGEVITEAIKREAPESGLYVLPNMSSDMHQSTEKQVEWAKKAKEGPYVFMSVKAEGMPWDMHLSMVGQFIIVLIVAFGAAWLVSKSAVSGVLRRATFIATVVTLGVVLTELCHWNWWGFPIRSAGINIADTLIGWFLAGMLMGHIVKKSNA